MPRLFIDTDDDDTFVEDEEGVDVSDAEAARDIALTALSEIARDKVPDGGDRTLFASIRDATGAVVYNATLSLEGEWKAKPSTS